MTLTRFLDSTGRDGIVSEIESFFEKENIDHAISLRVRLSIEDTLEIWSNRFGNEKKISLTTGKRWGRSFVEMRVAGEQFNPLNTSLSDEFQNFNEILLPSIGMAPDFSYKSGQNILNYRLPRQKPGMLLTLSAIIAASLLFGFVLKAFVSPQTLLRISGSLLQPLIDIFIQVLMAIAGPLFFLSIISRILGMDDKDSFGKLGARLTGRFLLVTFLISTAIVLLSLPGFGLLFGNEHGLVFRNIFNLFIGVIPGNFLSPFIENNILQIVTVAIVLGSALLILGEHTRKAGVVFCEVNEIMEVIMNWAGYLTPVFTALIVLNLVFTSKAGILLRVLVPVLIFYVLVVMVVLIRALTVAKKTGVKFPTLVKKLIPSFVKGLTSMSFFSTLGTLLGDCSRKFGMDDSLYTIGLPLGNTMLRPLQSARYVFFALFFAGVYLIPVNVSWIIAVAFTSYVIAVSSPSSSGTGIVASAMVFAQAGIPPEAIGVMVVVDFLMLMICTGGGISLSILELLAVGESEGMVNKETLARS